MHMSLWQLWSHMEDLPKIKGVKHLSMEEGAAPNASQIAEESLPFEDQILITTQGHLRCQ